MSDVRAELRRAFERGGWTTGTDELVDIVLARFDVVEKPVVTAEQMGRMVNYAANGVASSADADWKGRRMLEELEAAGLTIVRIEEAAE